jgi:hypothetical protein
VNHLTVGQSVTFNVDLSGVDPNDANTYLSFLTATVQYNSPLVLLSPSTVMAGPILPDPADFTGDSSTNGADGFYDAVFGADPSAPPISTNGTFFSFTVTTLAAGDGTISFVPGIFEAATFTNDPTQTSQIIPDTTSLNFHIEGGTVVVPEPGAHIVLLSCALAGGAAFAWRRLGRGPRAGGPAGDSTTP